MNFLPVFKKFFYCSGAASLATGPGSVLPPAAVGDALAAVGAQAVTVAADVPAAADAPVVAFSALPHGAWGNPDFFLVKFFYVCYLFFDFFVCSEYNTAYTSGNCTACTLKI